MQHSIMRWFGDREYKKSTKSSGWYKCLRLVKFEEYGELRMSYISVEHGIMSTLYKEIIE